MTTDCKGRLDNILGTKGTRIIEDRSDTLDIDLVSLEGNFLEMITG